MIHEHFCCNRRSAAFAREASFVKREAQDGTSVPDRRMRDTDSLHEERALARFLDELS
jgi:hypothetical protein